MDFKSRRIVWIKLMLVGIINIPHTEGAVCITAEDTCITAGETHECSEASESSWALGSTLTVNHTFTPSSTPFTVVYSLATSTTTLRICSYQYGSSSCSDFGGESYCISCSNKGSSVETVFSLPKMDITKNFSRLLYNTGFQSLQVQQFVLEGCPETEGDATAVGGLPDTCGYNCTTQFECSNGADPGPSNVHCCSAKARWEPSAPSCTKESTTSQANSTAISSSSNTTQVSDCEECDCCPAQITAAIAITVTGGIFVAVEIGIAIYICMKERGVPKAILLHAAFVVCAFAWTASFIVLFVVPDNCKCTVDGAGNCICTAAGEGECTCTAYIAGATIGGIAIVGEAVSVGIHIWAIAKKERK